MGEPGYAAPALAVGQSSLQDLKEKIESQRQSRRNVHHPNEKTQHNQNQNLCSRVQQDVSTQNPWYGTAGTDGGNLGV